MSELGELTLAKFSVDGVGRIKQRMTGPSSAFKKVNTPQQTYPWMFLTKATIIETAGDEWTCDCLFEAPAWAVTAENPVIPVIYNTPDFPEEKSMSTVREDAEKFLGDFLIGQSHSRVEALTDLIERHRAEAAISSHLDRVAERGNTDIVAEFDDMLKKNEVMRRDAIVVAYRNEVKHGTYGYKLAALFNLVLDLWKAKEEVTAKAVKEYWQSNTSQAVSELQTVMKSAKSAHILAESLKTATEAVKSFFGHPEVQKLAKDTRKPIRTLYYEEGNMASRHLMEDLAKQYEAHGDRCVVAPIPKGQWVDCPPPKAHLTSEAIAAIDAGEKYALAMPKRDREKDIMRERLELAMHQWRRLEAMGPLTAGNLSEADKAHMADIHAKMGEALHKPVVEWGEEDPVHLNEKQSKHFRDLMEQAEKGYTYSADEATQVPAKNPEPMKPDPEIKAAIQKAIQAINESCHGQVRGKVVDDFTPWIPTGPDGKPMSPYCQPFDGNDAPNVPKFHFEFKDETIDTAKFDEFRKDIDKWTEKAIHAAMIGPYGGILSPQKPADDDPDKTPDPDKPVYTVPSSCAIKHTFEEGKCVKCGRGEFE